MSVGDPPIHGCAHCQQLPAPIYLQTATSPSRLERVAEALFVQALASHSHDGPITGHITTREAAQSAIRRAHIFESEWDKLENHE